MNIITNILGRTIKIPADLPTPIRLDLNSGIMTLDFTNNNAVGPAGNVSIEFKNDGTNSIIVNVIKNAIFPSLVPVLPAGTFSIDSVPGDTFKLMIPVIPVVVPDIKLTIKQVTPSTTSVNIDVGPDSVTFHPPLPTT